VDLTDEQTVIVERSLADSGPLKVPAGAGCGKTYTLQAVAAKLQGAGRRTLYLAFNRAMKDEAAAKFGDTAEVATTHGFPFRVLGIGRLARGRKLGRIYPWQVADALRLPDPFLGVPAADYAAAVLVTLNGFLHDTAAMVADAHVPDWIRKRQDPAFVARVASHAQDLFMMASPGEKTRLPLPHDLYLKYWQVIGAPGLDAYDAVLLDEAQDSNPVVLAALEGRSVIYVGDTHQAIYSWRGAIDAMGQVRAPESPLTQSFRFGPKIAHLANTILARKSRPLKYPLKGLPRLGTEVTAIPLAAPCTRLYRTNYQMIRDAVVLSDRGQPVIIAGGMAELALQIQSAAALREGNARGVQDPLIRTFARWEDLVEASDRSSDLARELRQIVRIIEDYGDRHADVQRLLAGSGKPGHEAITLTTAHKAKGREWDRVELMADFDQTLSATNELDLRAAQRDEELNLLYVAATRATGQLQVRGAYLQAIARSAGLL
jgi:superfamily I DNA/RNA helicase